MAVSDKKYIFKQLFTLLKNLLNNNTLKKVHILHVILKQYVLNSSIKSEVHQLYTGLQFTRESQR